MPLVQVLAVFNQNDSEHGGFRPAPGPVVSPFGGHRLRLTDAAPRSSPRSYEERHRRDQAHGQAAFSSTSASAPGLVTPPHRKSRRETGDEYGTRADRPGDRDGRLPGPPCNGDRSKQSRSASFRSLHAKTWNSTFKTARPFSTPRSSYPRPKPPSARSASNRRFRALSPIVHSTAQFIPSPHQQSPNFNR